MIYYSLSIDHSETHCRHLDEFRRFINGLRHVHFAKKTQRPKTTINYLGRYLIRPPFSGAKLAHYRGEANLSFRYLDHHTGNMKQRKSANLS